MNIFDLFPNWANGLSINYSLSTTIHTADNRKEQRVCTQDRAVRTIDFNVFDNALPATKMVNNLISTLMTEIAVPVFSEGFTVGDIGDLYTVSDLSPVEDISVFYNLQKYKGAVIVYDVTGVIAPEFILISSLTGSTISLADGISSHIEGCKARIFPAMVGMLTDFPAEDFITDAMAEYSLSFTEKRVL